MNTHHLDHSLAKAYRFLFDEMLKGLARWLRAAGYDTKICRTGANDREVFAQARQEMRLLITRDRKFIEFRHAKETVILLQSNHVPDCAKELTQRLAINWLYQPFSRCLLCNTPLKAADSHDHQYMPEKSRALYPNHLWHCPQCNKWYWQGSHVKRMRQVLMRWNAD